MRNRISVTPAVLLLIALTPLRADEEHGRGEKLLSSGLVRVSELGSLGAPFSPVGTDPLGKGQLEVHRKRQVEVDLRGASPSASYDILFCKAGAASCATLGKVETNSDGDGEARIEIAAPENAWAGVFAVSRGGSVQYLSGFRLPAIMAQSAGTRIGIEGTIASVDATKKSFKLTNAPLEIFVDGATEFEGLANFGELKAGVEVEVAGLMRADGTVLAAKIESEGDRRKGRKRDRDEE
ncbi:MAG: hypothetical protein FJW37_14735 [Acidobacteria bacterium]|nr:hypothetical protein [Acidobacteriota bacterium]